MKSYLKKYKNPSSTFFKNEEMGILISKNQKEIMLEPFGSIKMEKK